MRVNILETVLSVACIYLFIYIYLYIFIQALRRKPQVDYALLHTAGKKKSKMLQLGAAGGCRQQPLLATALQTISDRVVSISQCVLIFQ